MTLRAPSALCTLLLLSQGAVAGPYGDERAKCLVAWTTQADRVALARWTFVAFSAHPSVAPISSVTAADIESSNAEVGSVFMKLTDCCREKTKIPLKYEGPAAIQLGFQVLGQVAGMELASSPDERARMSGFSKHIDPARLDEITKEPDAKAAN